MHPAVAGSCDGVGDPEPELSQGREVNGANTDASDGNSSRSWQRYASRSSPEPMVMWREGRGADGELGLPVPGASIRASMPTSGVGGGDVLCDEWEDPFGPESLSRASDALFETGNGST